MTRWSPLRLGLLITLAGCAADGESTTTSSTAGDDPLATPLADGEVDLRTQRPAADDAYLVFESGEATVAPGEEKMFCTHFTYDGPEVAFDDAQTLQGEKYGHHAIIMAAKQPLPDGTVEDCSDSSAMAKFDAFALPQQLPAGYGVRLETSRHLVMQSHYINTGKAAIRVRDFVRLHTVPVSSVTTWAAMFATNALELSVPPHESQTITFDCTVQEDGDLTLIGGHMHEWGASMQLFHGPDVDHLTSYYHVDRWRPEYRDLPPIELLWDNPIVMKKGDIFRTTCTFTNTKDEPLTFPHEMCSGFGYRRGTQVPEVCDKSTITVVTPDGGTDGGDGADGNDSADGGDGTDGTDGVVVTDPTKGVVTLRFTAASLVKSSRNLQDPLRGAVYGNLYLADDVTLTGPREGAEAAATVALEGVDLEEAEVSAASWTSEPLPPADYIFLGMMDVDGNGAESHDPDKGDPVTLPIDRFTVEKGKAIEHTVVFDLVYSP